MKKIILATIVLFAITSLFGLSAQNQKAAVGKWKYDVPQAPYGYNKGVLEIKEVKDKLSGEVTFSSGQDLKLQKLTMRNDTIWVNMIVDSENIEIIAKINKSTMKGNVHTSMGVIGLEAEKVVEVKD